MDDAYESTPSGGEGLSQADTNSDGTPDAVQSDANVLDNIVALVDCASATALENDTEIVTGTSSDIDYIILADGASATLDLTAIDNTNITGIERIDISGDSANVLTLDVNDLLDLSSTSDQLIVLGDADDTVNASGFTDSGTTQTIEGNVYNEYTNGSASLLIDEDINISM